MENLELTKKPIKINWELFDFHNEKDLPVDINLFDTIIKARANKLTGFTAKKILIDKRTKYVIVVVGTVKVDFPSGTSIERIIQSVHNTRLDDILISTSIDRLVVEYPYSQSINKKNERVYLKGECNCLEVEFV